ncbi:MAG: YIP1 family protein [Gammaproteobacteria bacterium]
MTLISPAWTIWFDPASTLKRLVHENPGYGLLVLPILAGFTVSPTATYWFGDGNLVPLGYVWGSLLSFGPLLELLQVFVGAWWLRLIGLRFGGRADTSSIQTVVAWSCAPLVVLLLLNVFIFLLTGALADIQAEFGGGQPSAVVAILLLGIELTVIVCSFNILVRGLAAVQGFSIRRALLSVVALWTAGLVFLLLITLIFSDTILLTPLLFGGMT